MSHRLPLADIQFIADFAAFCRTKGDEAYDYSYASRCALAQFGYPDVQYGALGCVPEEAFWAAIGEDIPLGEPHTFSALADRLEAILADTPVMVRS